MSELIRNKLHLHDEEVFDVVNKKLNGSIFHVTSNRGIRGIEKCGFIHSNYDKRFPLAHGGQTGYGLRNGFVDFFDLRNIDGDNPPYEYVYFPRPNNWTKYSFLIFNSKYYDELLFQNREYIDWQDIFPKGTKLPTKDEPANYIPKYECWYQSKCPVDKIIEIVDIQIIWTPQEKKRRELGELYKRI